MFRNTRECPVSDPPLSGVVAPLVPPSWSYMEARSPSLFTHTKVVASPGEEEGRVRRLFTVTISVLSWVQGPLVEPSRAAAETSFFLFSAGGIFGIGANPLLD